METPFADLTPLYPLVVPFGLVLFRVLGIFVFVPVFANASIPGNVKVLLGLAITLCVWNVVPRTSVVPGLIPLTLAIIAELGVGLLIGLMTQLIFMGIELGAHQLSQQMGLSMASVYDPMFDDQSTVIEQVAFWLTLMIFFGIGGHRQIIAVLVQSYHTVPMGRGLEPSLLLSVLVESVQASFVLSAKVAVPGLVIFLLVTLASGFITRSMPQINIMTVGIGMNLLVGFGMLLVGLSGWAMISGQTWQGFFDVLERMFPK